MARNRACVFTLGCAIARSNEAKELGVKMGAPWFQIQHLEYEAGLVGLSANFTLYGDMSDRMMTLAAGLGLTQEIYSIDESFVGLHGVQGDLVARAFKIRSRILRWTGIPTCIGIAPTKTLAKLANHIGKTAERKPGSYPTELAQVCNLAALPAHELDEVLQATSVGEVWGVGRRITKQIQEASPDISPYPRKTRTALPLCARKSRYRDLIKRAGNAETKLYRKKWMLERWILAAWADVWWREDLTVAA